LSVIGTPRRKRDFLVANTCKEERKRQALDREIVLSNLTEKELQEFEAIWERSEKSRKGYDSDDSVEMNVVDRTKPKRLTSFSNQGEGRQTSFSGRGCSSSSSSKRAKISPPPKPPRFWTTNSSSKKNLK
jgi:hypothetical protein